MPFKVVSYTHQVASGAITVTAQDEEAGHVVSKFRFVPPANISHEQVDLLAREEFKKFLRRAADEL